MKNLQIRLTQAVFQRTGSLWPLAGAGSTAQLSVFGLMVWEVGMFLAAPAQVPRREQRVGSDGSMHKCSDIGRHGLAPAWAKQ